MKEIKPRLILADRKQRLGIGSFWHFVIIIFAFCAGVYVGIRVGDMDLSVGVQRGAPKGQNPVPEDKIAIRRGGEGNLVEEETVSVQESSSTDVGESLSDTYPQGVGLADKDENNIIEKETKEFAVTEDKPKIGNKEGFSVQIGAFKNIERANKALSELNLKGYKPYILPYVNSLGGNWYLVRIGKFNTHEEAREYAISFQRTEGMEAIVEMIE
jgi:cell division protein FtsN